MSILSAEEAKKVSIEGNYSGLSKLILESAMSGGFSVEYTLPEQFCDFSVASSETYKDLPANWIAKDGHNFIRKLQELGYKLSLSYIQLHHSKQIILTVDWSP